MGTWYNYEYDGGTIVLGTDGYIEIRGEDMVLVTAKEKKKIFIERKDPSIDSFKLSHFTNINDFIDSILQGKKPPIDAENARKCLEVVMAGIESSKLGETVHLPLT
jgi:predicted dehydrogenase